MRWKILSGGIECKNLRLFDMKIDVLGNGKFHVVVNHKGQKHSERWANISDTSTNALVALKTWLVRDLSRVIENLSSPRRHRYWTIRNEYDTPYLNIKVSSTSDGRFFACASPTNALSSGHFLRVPAESMELARNIALDWYKKRVQRDLNLIQGTWHFKK